MPSACCFLRAHSASLSSSICISSCCFLSSWQWIPELRHYAPNVPIVLVGTKLGTLPSSSYQPKTNCGVLFHLKQGEELKKMIGAAVYIECSSKTQQNVKTVFDAAIKVVIYPPKPKRKSRKQRSCLIL
ncbi:hypothetical protein BHE74_00014333 [Ensete ventricosum]|nr:hypothetical protein BHE74_00014333 [Ensete ventricosum]